MVKPAIVALVCLILSIACGAALAQFNKCGPGTCPNGIFGSGGIAVPAGTGVVVTCVPGSATGSVDLSQCSNSSYVALIF